MVDSVVSSVIKKLGNYVVGEVKFLREVKREVVRLKEELESMRRFINDAQKRQRDDERIGQWVLDIMDIAYDCEDVLDEFIIKVHDKRNPDTLSVDQARISVWQGFFTCLAKICCFTCYEAQEQVDLYGIGKKIEELKGRLKDAAARRELYKLEGFNKKTEGESSARATLRTLRRTSSFQLEEMDVVGYEDDIRTLLVHLLDKKKPKRFVISIFGTGGLGKTTLAGKLYHHSEAKEKKNFSRRAWVSVSQVYNIKDLLQLIINSFNKDRDMPEMLQEDKTDDVSMGRYLHRSLKGQSYLVVIDDIWHKEAWDCLKRAFPDENNGSRVIMTTRNEDIARGVDDSTFPYELPFLTPDESWQLFCMKAFQNPKVDQGSKPDEWEMVKKCGGLPLAIVVLGGLLATKKPNELSKIRNIWKDMGNHNIQIKYLLDLSFDDLPSELKVCFLYLGLFPEDQEIKIRKLIRLWVAEGLISQEGDNTMEELAEDYLNQLIKKSLIQIGQIRRGRIFTCRVHDLLRDLAIQKAKELNFICTEHEIENSAESSKSRRHAFYLGRNTSLLLQHCNPPSRSLLFFSQYFHHQPTFLEGLLSEVCRGSQVVRVLDFDSFSYKNLYRSPEEIGKLIHLKYLGLRKSGITDVPSSIGKLLHLQTLDLPTRLENSAPSLPSEIGMLTELRHLIGFLYTELKIDNLTKLQTLKNVSYWLWNTISTEKLVNLRELKIISFNVYLRELNIMLHRDSRPGLTITSYGDTEKKEFTFDSIANLKSLRILMIELLYNDVFYFGSLEPLSHCEHLRDLNLKGKIQDLPGNLHELVPNLECLSLHGSNLNDDPMPKLEKLLYLTHLQLGEDSYHGSKMTCSANGFPRLEILNLCSEQMFHMLKVEEGALLALKKLKIRAPSSRAPVLKRSIKTPNYLARVLVECDTDRRL